MRISHTYEFKAKDVIAIVALPVIALAVCAAALRLGAASGILPRPCPALDTDRTILFHQAQASLSAQKAETVLIGDSSCLMDVSAGALERSMPGAHSTLNLGTLSYLDLEAFAGMLKRYAAANPGKLRTVVLLMNPEALRRPEPAEYDVKALNHFYAGTDFCGPALPGILCELGVETFRGRILSRVVPLPLAGSFGRSYGFTHDLWDYLSAHQGSALDPGRYDPTAARGNAEYRLAKSLERASRAFREAVPDGARLVVGITPVPEGFVGPNYRALRSRLLETWSGWLKADAALSKLPGTLPDSLFASTTHLNEEGVKLYTAQLGQALGSIIRAATGEASHPPR